MCNWELVCIAYVLFLFSKLYCEFIPTKSATRDVRCTGYNSCHLCLYLFKLNCFVLGAVNQTTSAYYVTGLIKEK